MFKVAVVSSRAFICKSTGDSETVTSREKLMENLDFSGVFTVFS